MPTKPLPSQWLDTIRNTSQKEDEAIQKREKRLRELRKQIEKIQADTTG